MDLWIWIWVIGFKSGFGFVEKNLPLDLIWIWNWAVLLDLDLIWICGGWRICTPLIPFNPQVAIKCDLFLRQIFISEPLIHTLKSGNDKYRIPVPGIWETTWLARFCFDKHFRPHSPHWNLDLPKCFKSSWSFRSFGDEKHLPQNVHWYLKSHWKHYKPLLLKHAKNTLSIRMDHYFWPKFAKLDLTHWVGSSFWVRSSLRLPSICKVLLFFVVDAGVRN